MSLLLTRNALLHGGVGPVGLAKPVLFARPNAAKLLHTGHAVLPELPLCRSSLERPKSSFTCHGRRGPVRHLLISLLSLYYLSNILFFPFFSPSSKNLSCTRVRYNIIHIYYCIVYILCAQQMALCSASRRSIFPFLYCFDPLRRL